MSKINKINNNDNIYNDVDSTSPNSPKKMSPKNQKEVLSPNSIKFKKRKKQMKK